MFEQSYAFTLWTYLQLVERDRKRDWVARMDRLRLAQHIAQGFHKPELLADEQERILDDARPDSTVEQTVTDATKMWAEFSELLEQGRLREIA